MENHNFKLSRVSGAPVSDDALLQDLRRVAQEHALKTVPLLFYDVHGRFDYTTIARRFGSWNKALKSAGLFISNEINYPDSVLFENVLRLWQHYGRQPRRRELAQLPSSISQSP